MKIYKEQIKLIIWRLAQKLRLLFKPLTNS